MMTAETLKSIGPGDRVSYTFTRRGETQYGFGDVLRLQSTSVVLADKKHVGNKRTVVPHASITAVVPAKR